MMMDNLSSWLIQEISIRGTILGNKTGVLKLHAVFSLKLATDRNSRPSCWEDGSLHSQPKMNSRLSVGLSSAAISSVAPRYWQPPSPSRVSFQKPKAQKPSHRLRRRPTKIRESCYLIRFFDRGATSFGYRLGLYIRAIAINLQGC
jgi:hypothetical protein